MFRKGISKELGGPGGSRTAMVPMSSLSPFSSRTRKVTQRISDVPSSGLGSNILVIEKLPVPHGSSAVLVARPVTSEPRFSVCGIFSFAFWAELICHFEC